MHSTGPAVVLLLALTASAPSALARTAVEAETVSSPAGNSSIVVAPFFRQLVDDLLGSSPTLRRQYERILSARLVIVRVEPLSGMRGGRSARAVITRSSTGVVLARVELATPLRTVEYAEMLAHEFEHVLEQIDGVNLRSLADGRAREASRLYDGSYETARAKAAGRAAALEIRDNADAPRP